MSTRRSTRPQGPPDAPPAPKPAAKAESGDDSTSEAATIRDIGKGFRWYDLPYLVLSRLDRPRLMLRLPVRWRLKVREATSFLYQTHHTRERRSSERRSSDRRYTFDSITLPADEAVSIPSAWVIEYFTASGVNELYNAIRRSGWDGARFLGSGRPGTESLTESRSGQGQSWWRIAELTSEPGGYSFLEAQLARLPRGVRNISLTGVSIGKGLTAVVASFSLDETVSARITELLHAPHRDEVIRRRGQRAVSQPPPAVLHSRVQRARSAVHHELREWVSRALPGAFARAGHPQPIFDAVFFNVADALADDSSGRRTKNDALRAIGVNANSVYRVTSAELPQMILEQPDFRDWVPEISENVWSFWGNRSAEKALTEGTGNSGVNAAGYYFGSHSTDFMARMGLTALLRLLRKEASAAHDNARRLHGGTNSRDLRRLKNRTLTTSLDLATLEDDIRSYNSRRWRDREPQFFLDYADWFKRRHAEGGPPHFEPIDINRSERKLQKQLARELVAFDGGYREVLSTVASLAASIDSRRVQRIAIWVSVVSVAVALVTLWATQETPPDLIASGCALLAGLGGELC